MYVYIYEWCIIVNFTNPGLYLFYGAVEYFGTKFY